MLTGIELQDDEEDLWTEVDECGVYILSGIKEKRRAAAIRDWFKKMFNCEATAAPFAEEKVTRYIVRVTFAPKE